MSTRHVVKHFFCPTGIEPEKAATVTMRGVVLGLLLVPVMGVWTMSLAGVFRRRLRDLLETKDLTQVALATHLKLDQGRISRILKYDHAAGTVPVQRLEDMAGFLGVPPADLLRSPEHMPLDLTPDELDVIKYFRMLPANLRGHLIGFLRGMFAPLEKAREQQQMNRILRASLNREMERQHQPRAR